MREEQSTPAKPLLQALRGSKPAVTPVWLMRQAGRYLPEYRELRKQARNFLDFCYTPEMAVEASLQPIRRFDLDAVIMFSDILVIPDALGQDVAFHEGKGPVLKPIKPDNSFVPHDLAVMHEHLAPVYEVLKTLKHEIPPHVALIGFSGAPWTLAAYMLEGGGSKDYAIARAIARQHPKFFQSLIQTLTDAIISYALRQISSGAEVIQIFDSWAGTLAPSERQRWCFDPISAIAQGIKSEHPDVPVIAFPRGVGAAYEDFAKTVSVDGISLDTTVSAEWAQQVLPPSLVPCLQGNLDPVLLLEGGTQMLQEASHLTSVFRERAHIFNLGHGVLPHVPPENVAKLLEHLKN